MIAPRALWFVSQHPFCWYSCPALFKEWQDVVLTYGFAYAPSDGKELHGKHWLSVLTTGGPAFAYPCGGLDDYGTSELLEPMQQTANLCGMRWQLQCVVHGVLPEGLEGVRATGDDELARGAGGLRAWVQAFDPDERHGPEPDLPPHYIAATRS